MKTLRYGLIALAAAGTFAPLSSRAYTYHKLYDFCSQQNCADSGSPRGRLLLDSAGNLYGTADFVTGATSSVVFELVKNGGAYSYSVLHTFNCSMFRCDIGPSLIADKQGNLYGTMYSDDNPNGAGEVFELLAPSRKGTVWSVQVLHNFCAEGYPCANGDAPYTRLTYQGQEAGMPYDGKSPLYGTTFYGGVANQGEGVAYRLSGAKNKTYEVIYNFCSQQNCADGVDPTNDLLVDANGNVFGMSNDNGGGAGGVFEISPNGKAFAYTVLYTFCHNFNGNWCLDGDQPYENGLTLNADGGLLGATPFGGTCNTGLLFKLVPNGTNSQESSLYPNVCPGYPAHTKPLLDPAGNIFWTDVGDQNADSGTVWKNDTVIYNFCQQTGCPDGNFPNGVIADPSGNLFGVTRGGGANAAGVIFELTP